MDYSHIADPIQLYTFSYSAHYLTTIPTNSTTYTSIQNFSSRKLSSRNTPSKAQKSTITQLRPKSKNSPKQQTLLPSKSPSRTVAVASTTLVLLRFTFTYAQSIRDNHRPVPSEGLKVSSKNLTSSKKNQQLSFKTTKRISIFTRHR